MTTVFENATIVHVSGRPHAHQAAHEVLPPEGFETARAEISQWDGYAPTPLYNLKALAESLALSEILYKDEGPRFGLVEHFLPWLDWHMLDPIVAFGSVGRHIVR